MKQILLGAILVIALVGYDDAKKRVSGQNGGGSVQLVIDGAQDVYEVPFESMKSFLIINRHIRSICPVDRGGNGFTTSFLVVLENER